MPTNWKTIVGITVALILGGCVTDERDASVNPSPISPAAPGPPALDPVVAANDLPTAPAAVFSGLDGKTVSLSELRGKVVYIDFWAPWCAPCRAALPFTERLSTTFKDKGLVVLAVSGDPAKSVKAFMAANAYTFRAVLDTKNIAQKFNVEGIPHTIILDREGHIVSQDEGLAPQAETIRNLTKAGLNTTGFEPLHDPTLDAILG